MLTKFHSSNQGISPIKNPPKEHLKCFQRMAIRLVVIDSLLMYRDELMPNHYRIMVLNDIQLQRHLSRGPIMIAPKEYIGDVNLPMKPSHTTVIGQMWLSM